MHYENVGSPVLLIDTIGKFYSNCGSRDCIRSSMINETRSIEYLNIHLLKKIIRLLSFRTFILALIYIV